jgi:hypothetical protein
VDTILSAPIPAEELGAIVEKYGDEARHLSETCNIPKDFFNDLCIALADARAAYEDVPHHEAHQLHVIENRRGDAQQLEHHGAELLAAWHRLDGSQRRAFDRQFHEEIGGRLLEWPAEGEIAAEHSRGPEAPRRARPQE